jgi:luciferase family oxidoreductase group 1
MIPLSVLDLATVATGSSPAQALRETTMMAISAEPLGYRRFWPTEHHAMAAVASSAPAVLMAHLANATSTLRIGTGGVMLPNHSTLVIAEQFAPLVALHPDESISALVEHRTPTTSPLGPCVERATFTPVDSPMTSSS